MTFGTLTREPVKQFGAPSQSQAPVPRLRRSDAAPISSYILFAVAGIAVALVGKALISPPLLTYPAGKIRYHPMTLALEFMTPEAIALTKTRRKKGAPIDFSIILTPSKLEETKAMKSVARKCLPRERYWRKASAKNAHGALSNSTDYLVCALETKVERLCTPRERKRLVNQLMRYLVLRQHLIGIETAWPKMANMVSILRARQSGYIIEYSKASRLEDAAIAVRYPNSKIGNELDVRISHRMTALAEKGYLSASDFSFLGLVLPQMYAPSLTVGSNYVNSCAA